MRLTATMWLAALVLGAGGCAQPNRASVDPLGAAPTDFAVELTILTGADAPTTNDVHRRQSRYVLFADGSLYQGEDPERSHGADWLPPLTRVLTRRQQADVWSLAQRLGFTDPASAHAGAVNFKRVTPPRDGLAYLAAFSGWGERWTYVRPCDAGDPDPGMTELTRALARLAWSSDQPPEAVTVAPRRYDFGPDPYARFRQPGGAPAAEVSTQRNGGDSN